MNRLFGTLPIAAALAFCPVGMAQETEPQQSIARYFNAALEYWKLWETMDSALIYIVEEADAASHARVGSPSYEALIKLQPDIQAIIRASQMPTCDWQIDYTQGFDALLPHLGKIRMTASILRADAQRLVGAGDIEGATVRAVAIVNIGLQVSEGNFLIGSLVGMAVGTTSSQVTDDILDSQKTTQADRDMLLAAYNQIDMDDLFGLTEALVLERDIALDWLESEFIGENARDPSGLLPALIGEIETEKDHPLNSFTDEDMVNDLAKLSSAYNALLAAWNSDDAARQFADVNLAVDAGDFGELAKVVLPALSSVRRSSDLVATTINATKARIAETKDQETGIDK